MWTEATLNDRLVEPTQPLIDTMTQIQGDLMILGAGGKMGPTLAVLAARARRLSQTTGRILAVSRFTDKEAASYMKHNGVDLVPLDLLADDALSSLPDVPNIIYMAGRKFGTAGAETETWAMNAALPALVSRRFRDSRIVVFSSGNVYPPVKINDGGCTETCPPGPIGEYAMSCLARERLFQHTAKIYGSHVLLYRLNYAVDLRYGVLHDLALKILNGTPISLKTPAFNCVWQGYANEVALRSLLLAESPAAVLNVTGPETVFVTSAAQKLARFLGKRPIFQDDQGTSAYLSNASCCIEYFGYPAVSLDTLIRWQAEWLLSGGRSLGKPTHFEEQEGQY
jgi:nucleoside-diphosphate-sugar epimerase